MPVGEVAGIACYVFHFMYTLALSLFTNDNPSKKWNFFYMYKTASDENIDVFVLDYNKGMLDEYLYIGTLKSLFNNPEYSPQCNEQGTLTVSLPIGSYKVLAKNSKKQME